MQPKTPKLLEDIRDAAAFIREATRGKTVEDYRLLTEMFERVIDRTWKSVSSSGR